MTEPTAEQLAKWRADPCAFIEDTYLLPDRQPIELEPWQRELIEETFAQGDDGLRRFNLALWLLAKKNGKSTLASAVGCWALLCDEPAAEVYSLAGDRDQARIIFGMARGAVQRSPILSHWCRVLTNEIVVPSTESVWRVLAADAPTAHGLNPSCVIFDEAWQYKADEGARGRDLWDAVTTSPTRKQPLYLVTSYGGSDRNSLLFGLLKQAKDDPRAYVWWRQGENANLAIWITPEYLKQQRRRLPDTIYRRLHRCEFVSGEDVAFSRDEIGAVFTDELKPKAECRLGQHFAGVDLGLSHDATAVVVVHRNAEGIVVDDVMAWRGEPERKVQLADVEAWLLAAKQRFSNLKVYAETYQAIGMVQRLKEKAVRIEEFTPTSTTVQQVSKNLFSLIRERRLRCFASGQGEELRRELEEVEISETSYGWRLQSDRGAMGHGDRVSALGIAALKAAETNTGGLNTRIRWLNLDDKDETRDDVDWIEGKGRYARD